MKQLRLNSLVPSLISEVDEDTQTPHSLALDSRFCFDEGDIKELLCPVKNKLVFECRQYIKNLYSLLLREISY